MTAPPQAIEEMSAGFCNWVYRVDMPAPVGQVVVKLFSPLAKYRLAPDLRGHGDEVAGAHGIGPRLHFRNAQGLICDFLPGDTLTEADMHGESVELPKLIAPRLAELHSLSLSDAATHSARTAREPVLWNFLDAMLSHVESGGDEGARVAASLIDVPQVRREVSRMRARFDALELPVVVGHGDLKPSNVMLTASEGERICFIDFELAGAHYRGYDLFKLFRTAGKMSTRNLKVFLSEYLDALPGAPTRAESRELMLEEIYAETLAAEPLTWLEAAVFFLFAVREYPSERERWAPLATQRWTAYLVSASAIDDGGAVTSALRSARQAIQACMLREP